MQAGTLPRSSPRVEPRGTPARGPDLRYHVQVVDDEPDITASLQGILELAIPDARVHTACDGPDALEVLKQQRMDLVIADYRMPAMDGIEFLRRAEAIRPGAARILITAYADLSLAVRAINEAAIDRFYTKPVEGRALAEAVRGLLLQQRDRNSWSREFMDTMGQLRRKSSLDDD